MWSFTFLMENIYVQFDSMVYQQIVWIPMDNNCAPLIADLFLYCYERDFMSDLHKSKSHDLIDMFNDVLVCVVTLPFWHFCWCRGFCHRTESDIFLFLLKLWIINIKLYNLHFEMYNRDYEESTLQIVNYIHFTSVGYIFWNVTFILWSLQI